MSYHVAPLAPPGLLSGPNPTDDPNEAVLCAVLAAQAAALRDGIDGGGNLELLWRTTDALAQLVELVHEAAGRTAQADAAFAQRCAHALAATAPIGHALDELTFRQAQQQDLARQMADCVATALHRMATADVQTAAPLSLHDLSAMYVSDTQRRVHAAAMQAFPFAVTADHCEASR